MKKKAIKIAASTAVAASAFVAAAPAQQADAATNVNQLATDAQNAGTVLKWAISVEGSADYVTRPYTQYNAAKKAIAAAEAAAKKLSASEKLSVDAKLVEPKLQVKRAAAYIDAITSSEKIKDLTSKLDAAIKTDDIEKVETAYHAATGEYRKQAALLDRVYGQSTRDGIRNEVKPAIEKLVASVKNEVTVNMLSKAAAADVKADKLEDASKKIAEAQAILDANVLKWETALQKSVDDVATSLPLVAVSASYVNANTVQVKLSKKVDAVNLSQFTSEELVINAVELGDDKRTVTLTTGTQSAGKTYTIAYNGKTVSYTVPTSGGGSTIITDGTAVHGEAGTNVAFSATFKEKTGQAYNGQIRITPPEGTTIVSVNGATGLTTDANGAVVTTPTQTGTVSVVVTSPAGTSVNGEKAKFEKLFNGSVTDTSYSGSVYLYVPATDLTGAIALGSGKTVQYVDAANKYFVVTDGALTPTLTKYKVKATDAFANESTNGLTVEQFLAALNKGDVLAAPVYTTASNSASQFKIEFNKVVADFDFASKYFVKGNEDKLTGAYRVDSNGKFALEGTGQAGYTVYVTANGVTKYTTTVKSNGTWSVDVNLDQLAFSSFEAFQLAAGENPAGKTATANVNILEGAFEIEQVELTGSSADSLLGKVITFTDSVVSTNDNFVKKAGATITLVDEDGTKVKYTDGVNARFAVTSGNTSEFTITITGAYTPVANGSIAGFGKGFSIDSFTGVTNSYGLIAQPVITVLSK
ncbi:hypothetical protein PGC35_02615 [Psychrobacillus sp. PGGUH221]|uniref:hypothetical protein n=1 Tax=Psychrobacillus sp. PGGUH221 TaxID=3020058 RepID=UPI0035C761A4